LGIIFKFLFLLESTQLIVLSLNLELQPRYSLLVLCMVSSYSLQAVQEDALHSALDPQNKFSMIFRKTGPRIRASENCICSNPALKI
jgi:hypothetical protein